jgi:hypothetical protein
LEDVELKQGLLGEQNVQRRVVQVVEAMQAVSLQFNPALRGYPTDPGNN